MDSAALTLTLFAHGWLFFNNAALTWDDGHHTVPAPEIDGTQIADLVMFANTECGPGSDLNDICSMALKGMQAVAAANIPREPREMLPSELLAAVPQGDITAVSLVQLLHDPQLWQAEQTGADAYNITCDTRLASALPHCREMLSRLVDALRSVDPALTGAASYTFNLTGSDTPWDAASAPEPESEAEVKVEVKKDSIQDRETELLEQLSEQISMLEKRLAALDPAPLRAKLDALTQERAGLGFFKFSAKKALDMRIEQVQQELSDLASKDADRAHLQTLLDTTVRTIDNMRKAHEEQA